jgi:tRNA-Thr(GGU) m(6)t(6)A37 methyltransferase TsaA
MQLVCDPIGVIHTGKVVKFDTPHQPTDGVSEVNVIELYQGRRLEEGLKDLEGFERIWLIWWFDRNTNWRPLVTPPRGAAKRRGVLATRSPHRPNPIGITAVPLISIEGHRIVVGNTDLLDKTPILDIKPYISSVDAFPNQRQGWLNEVEAELEKPARYTVALSALVTEQIEWLRQEWGIEFMSKTVEILRRTPQRSRTHRISAPKDGVFRLSSGGWRVFFKVEGFQVTVLHISSGFPSRLLIEDGFEVVPHWEAQLAFSERWTGEEVLGSERTPPKV